MKQIILQQKLLLNDPNAWYCPNCHAGVDALAYSEEITVYFSNIRVEDKDVYISAPHNDASCPDGQRLWCSECDTYIWGDQADDEGTATHLQVHYE